jgi:hypothetical protein
VWNARAPSSLTVQYCPSDHFLHRYAWHAPVATRQGPMTILVPQSAQSRSHLKNRGNSAGTPKLPTDLKCNIGDLTMRALAPLARSMHDRDRRTLHVQAAAEHLPLLAWGTVASAMEPTRGSDTKLLT